MRGIVNFIFIHRDASGAEIPRRRRWASPERFEFPREPRMRRVFAEERRRELLRGAVYVLQNGYANYNAILLRRGNIWCTSLR